jgi:hypothetical protein
VVEAAAEKPFPNERLVTREANGKNGFSVAGLWKE